MDVTSVSYAFSQNLVIIPFFSYGSSLSVLTNFVVIIWMVVWVVHSSTHMYMQVRAVSWFPVFVH